MLSSLLINAQRTNQLHSQTGIISPQKIDNIQFRYQLGPAGPLSTGWISSRTMAHSLGPLHNQLEI